MLRKSLCFFCMSLMVLSFVSCGRSNREEGNIPSSTTGDVTVDEAETESSFSEQKDLDTDLAIKEENVDLSSDFHGINGCAVLYSPEDNQYFYYNTSMCEQRVSPFSTFKIISTLLGLQNGIISDESSTMDYDGSQYANTEWNRNLTLKEAFQTSCIWYFRQVIDTVGKANVQETLNDLSYGNCDISEWEGSGVNSSSELNGFWLDASLEISPTEQVQVLSKIFDGNSTFAPSDVEILKNIMFVDHDGTKIIYGKTGSGTRGRAWFVGFAEEKGTRKYFAVYLSDDEQGKNISDTTAKDIALKILN